MTMTGMELSIKNEMCQVWLIKPAEPSSGNDYSNPCLRILPKKSASVPLVHRKAVSNEVVRILDEGELQPTTTKTALSPLIYLAPGRSSTVAGDNEESGEGGGGM